MTVAIFGAASAIAQACARQWAARGARFFLVDQRAERLVAVAADLRVRGARGVQTQAADLTDDAVQEQAVRAMQSLGPVAVALVAYGILGDQQRAQREAAETRRILEVNLVSAVVLLQRLGLVLEQQRAGVLLVVSSVAGDRGRASNYVYGAAKGGLAIAAAGLRARLAGSGVQVVTIKPGFVDTPMTAAFTKGFLWSSPERVARDVVRAASGRRAVVYTPWFWRYLMLVIQWLPERVFVRLPL